MITAHFYSKWPEMKYFDPKMKWHVLTQKWAQMTFFDPKTGFCKFSTKISPFKSYWTKLFSQTLTSFSTCALSLAHRASQQATSTLQSWQTAKSTKPSSLGPALTVEIHVTRLFTRQSYLCHKSWKGVSRIVVFALDYWKEVRPLFVHAGFIFVKKRKW